MKLGPWLLMICSLSRVMDNELCPTRHSLSKKPDYH